MSHTVAYCRFVVIIMKRYKMKKKEVNQKKWELIHENNQKRYTCYYSPNERHSLCPHQEKCLLNEDYINILSEIQQNKKEIKNLKMIYDDAIDNYKKTGDSDYVNFNPKNNVIQRRMLEMYNKKNYQRIRNLKTKPGGFP